MDARINIAIAGTTKYTLMCIETLIKDSRFKIQWILTPSPKKIGRQQTLTSNPVHAWANAQKIPLVLVSQKIDSATQEKILALNQQYPVDLLLVVDFGYYIPRWLLNLPARNTLNLHPSALPKWRGSSPGQFVLLSGEKESAITLMELISQMDAGPIIKQLSFPVEDTWTSVDYYQHSFNLATQNLGNWLTDYNNGELKPKDQPTISPTPMAHKLSKLDAFVPWPILKLMLSADPQSPDTEQLSNTLNKKRLLSKLLEQLSPAQWPELIERASRAFTPWPLLWTKIPTAKGEKRMQILSCDINTNKNTKSTQVVNLQNRLKLKQVKIEGQQTASWEQVRNAIQG
jgi:methionyl-tRNA formyltransferase